MFDYYSMVCVVYGECCYVVDVSYQENMPFGVEALKPDDSVTSSKIAREEEGGPSVAVLSSSWRY